MDLSKNQVRCLLCPGRDWAVKFYLGTHKAHWLGKTSVPLFISARILRERKTVPKALGSWALDSGGFSELEMFGEWKTSPRQYADEVSRWGRDIGGLDWAAIQDWMCEPVMLRRTGKSVEEHQALTVRSFQELVALDESLPWMPVLQGWEVDDYKRHLEAYRAAGYEGDTFGIGSTCRRQATTGVGKLICELAVSGLKLHAFGFKTRGLAVSHLYLASSDSLAWSYDARRSAPMPGHTHASCSNCIDWAMRWRDRLLSSISPPQLDLLV